MNKQKKGQGIEASPGGGIRSLPKSKGIAAIPSSGLKPLRKDGGIEPSKRSDSLTVRLEPRIRYLLEIASRKQRRSVSSFAEAAICDALEQAPLDGKRTVGQANDLWDVDEVDRFVKLGQKHPELMTYQEQIVWKLATTRIPDEFGELSQEALDLTKLRKHWKLLHAIARGEASASELPDD